MPNMQGGGEVHYNVRPQILETKSTVYESFIQNFIDFSRYKFQLKQLQECF